MPWQQSTCHPCRARSLSETLRNLMGLRKACLKERSGYKSSFPIRIVSHTRNENTQAYTLVPAGRRESVVDCPWAAKTLFDALSRIGNISDSDVQAETAKALCQVLAVFSSVPADSRRYANSQLRKWLSQVKGWKTDPSCQKILRVFGNGEHLNPYNWGFP